jgi:hypothetical protein
LKPTWANSSETLSCKYPTQNRADGMIQVVECLPSKSLNSSATKKKKKKKSLRIVFSHTKDILAISWHGLGVILWNSRKSKG